MDVRGYFYVVQPVPTYLPWYLKLGWTAKLDQRLSAYRILCPEVALLASWPSWKSFEHKAMEFATQDLAERIKGEVYKCYDLEALVERLNRFYCASPTSIKRSLTKHYMQTLEQHLADTKKKRSPGHGTIYQRSDGRWCAQITLPDRTRRSFYGKTRADVAVKLAKALAQQEKAS